MALVFDKVYKSIFNQEHLPISVTRVLADREVCLIITEFVHGDCGGVSAFLAPCDRDRMSRIRAHGWDDKSDYLFWRAFRAVEIGFDISPKRGCYNKCAPEMEWVHRMHAFTKKGKRWVRINCNSIRMIVGPPAFPKKHEKTSQAKVHGPKCADCKKPPPYKASLLGIQCILCDDYVYVCGSCFTQETTYACRYCKSDLVHYK